MDQVPLKPLHSDEKLIPSKLEDFRRISNEVLVDSLRPGQSGSLKARPDGTILDGHHRIKVLRERSIDVETLPREIIARHDAETGL